MDIDNFIKIYENSLTPRATANFIQYCKKINFEQQRVGGSWEKPEGYVNKKIRDVSGWSLSNWHKSITEAHWFNLFSVILKNLKDSYENEFPDGLCVSKINNITVLKYEEGQHYKMHSDHFTHNPRAISFIWFLNNDYEGGELNFHCPKTHKIIKTIKPGVSKVVIFPSNFMFPHSISTIKKGTRYSIVSWMS